MRSLIGDKKFYQRVLMIMMPIMIQNGITNFVNMLDNVMIGRVGNVEMTGVAIANQFIFVFNLCIFGGISGASVFGAQFYGKGDHKGLQYTLRFKIILSVLLTIGAMVIFVLFGNELIGIYLNGEGNAKDIAASMRYARQYMLIMFVGLMPYVFGQCYSSTLRETGETRVPMFAGMIAVATNLCLNYILIFGKFGAPALGVKGAAIATVISRFVELFVVAMWTHLHTAKNQFAIGLYKSLRIPKQLIKQISIKGFPLLINETMWAAGMALINQSYSTRGYEVVAANNICQTFFNVFGVAFMAVGAAIAIILGQLLGAGKLEEAKDTSRKLIAFSVFVSTVVACVFFLFAEWIPQFYNTSDTVRDMAGSLMRICALTLPIEAMPHACYFTLRSGGKIYVTLLFDSAFVWCISLPVAFALTSGTVLSVLAVYAICQSLNLIKCVAGCILVEKGIWIKNIVE
jgi:putative MATE family efflux protein